ncbi:MAG: DUF2723 domain-containing protein [Elusimicrobia bacterium]|nr:DUF2723 domain-containing protein [Elusimicrobiota bacterium]
MPENFHLTAAVVIPAYNEAKRISATLEALTSHIRQGTLKPLDIREIIISDDGSNDETEAVVRKFKPSLPNLKLIKSKRNFGKGHAVRTGFFQASADWVLVADADMSTPWTEARRLALHCLQQKASGAIGSRGLPESNILKHQSFFRERLGKSFNLLVRALTRLPYTDTQCGFKLFKRQEVEKIFASLKIDRFAWDVEFLVFCRRAGVKIVEIPVTWENSEQTRVRMLRDGFDMAFSVLSISPGNAAVPALFACAAFFVPLAAYLLTLAPTAFWQDSGIYLAAAREFGIPYPTGFPLYVIMTYLAGLVPIGTFAQRVHTVSALAGAGTCLAVYLTVVRLSIKGERPGLMERSAAFIMALGAGFSFALWCQAVNSEVYSLHAFIVALMLYFLLRLDENPSLAWSLWPLACVAGLGFANHPMIVGMLPVLCFAIWKHKDKARTWLKVFPVFLLAGLLPYAYFPFRSRANPLTDWGDPETLGKFIHLISATHWTAEKASYSFFGHDFWMRVVDLFRLFFLQFGPVAIPLGFIGGIALHRKKYFWFWCLTIACGFALFLPMLYHQTAEFESWFIPAYIVFTIAAGQGTFEAIQRINARWPDRPGMPWAFLLALALVYPGLLLTIALPDVNRAKDWDAEDYATNILRGVGPGAIFFISGDNPSSTVLYEQAALDLRRDVAAVNIDALWAPWYRDHMNKNLHLSWGRLRAPPPGSDYSPGDYAMALIRGNPGRPAYILIPKHLGSQPNVQFSPAGMVFRISETHIEEPAWKWDFKFHDPETLIRKRRPDQRRLINDIRREMKLGFLQAYSTGGAEFLQRNDFKEAALLYAKAVELAPDREDLRLRLGVVLAQMGDYPAARGVFTELVKLFPENYQAYYDLGNVLLELGDKREAQGAYLRALEIEPGFEMAKKALGGL